MDSQNSVLRILVIDDSENDQELIKQSVSIGGINAVFDCVMSKLDIFSAIDNKEYDVIVCDYSLPDINALDILEHYKNRNLDIPFIGTSGFVSEQALVDLVKCGAHGFFLKKNLDFLPDLIKKELNDYRSRKIAKSVAEDLKFIESFRSKSKIMHSMAEEYYRLFNSIILNLDLARSVGLPDECMKYVDHAGSAANKALKLATNVMVASGKTVEVNDIIDFQTFFRYNQSYFRLFLRDVITLTIDLEENLPSIKGDKILLREVLSGLIRNAVEAIAAQVSAADVKISVKKEADFVRISVSDTGCGIEKNTIQKVFEPFFTTKESSFGLGLSYALGVIQAHRGKIEIDSQIGVGTTVQVYLPVYVG